MSSLVLGYDGSPSANAALAKVVELAPALRLDVVVVFAYYISPLGGGDVKDYHDALARMGEHELGRARADLEAAGLRVETRLVSDKAADAILAVADEVDAALVAVGTVGESPISGRDPRLGRPQAGAALSAPAAGGARGRGVSSTATVSPDVRLVDVVKEFDDVRAVDGVSVEIPSGSFFALLGPSGCGKTTTLRMIGGFEEPTAGQIFLGDGDVVGLPPYRRDVNTVFQSYALFPHMTVFDNVAFGLERKGRREAHSSGSACSRCSSSSTSPAREQRKPKQLSGGQQQRVALARAIVNNPRVLLLDEPLGALDLKLRKQMQLELKRIQHDLGLTFVHVTHDQEEAMTMADTIAVMNRGRIEQLGTPSELYERPRTAFVAGFLGKSNLLAGTVVADGLVRLVDGTEVRGDTVGLAGDVAAGVRPEKVRLGEGLPNRLTGKVKESAYIGVATEVVVTTASGDLTVFHQNVEAGGVVAAAGKSRRPELGAGSHVRDPDRHDRTQGDVDDRFAQPSSARPAWCARAVAPLPAQPPRGLRWRWRHELRRAQGHPQLLELAALHRLRREDQEAPDARRVHEADGDHRQLLRGHQRQLVVLREGAGPSLAGARRSTATSSSSPTTRATRSFSSTKGWVEPLDKEKIPNIENLIDAQKSPTFDPDRTYSLPWQSGMTGIAWNEDVTGPVTSVEQLLDRPEAEGQGHDADRDGRLRRAGDARQRRRSRPSSPTRRSTRLSTGSRRPSTTGRSVGSRATTTRSR